MSGAVEKFSGALRTARRVQVGESRLHPPRTHKHLKQRDMSKPTKNPFLPEDKQPLMECWTCGHYRSREEDGFQDWVRGRCDHTGSSVVPPRHVCEAWCKRTKKKGGEE